MGEQSLRHAATTMQRLAEQVREIADRTMSETDVRWQGAAADAFRDQLTGRSAAIRDCAGRLETAAQRLRWYADRCHQQAQHRLPGNW